MPIRKRRGLESERAAIPQTAPNMKNETIASTANIHRTSEHVQRGLEQQDNSEIDKEG